MLNKPKAVLALLTLVLMLMTAVLSACGSKQPESADGSKGPQANLPVTERVVTDGAGRSVQVPAQPERIVAINNFGELAALGIKPIGALNYYLDNLDASLVKGVESVGGQEPNIEKVLALSPDLILISSYMKPEMISSLEKIAPTYVTKWGTPPFGQLKAIAELTGRQEAEKQFLAQYEAKVQTVKQKLGAVVKPGETALVLQLYSKQMYVHPVTAFPTVYETLGFGVPDKIKDLKKPTAIAEEGLSEFAADHLFLLIADATSTALYEDLKTRPVWKSNPAVQQGKVYEVPNVQWSELNAYNMSWQLDDFMSRLERK